MKVGVSGHRRRDHADWGWVRARIEELVADMRIAEGYTSLAPGADQIFAEILLAQEKPLVAVIPVWEVGAERADDDRPGLERLMANAERVIEVGGRTPEEAFLRAGETVVDLSQFMILVWDGEPARGPGGTADIASYAARRQTKGVILDPIARTVRALEAAP